MTCWPHLSASSSSSHPLSLSIPHACAPPRHPSRPRRSFPDGISSSFTASPLSSSSSSSSPAEIFPFPPAHDRRRASRNPRRLAGFAGRLPRASGVGPCSDSRVGEGDARGECSTSSSPAVQIRVLVGGCGCCGCGGGAAICPRQRMRD
jgi:hypothetical protein